jgi:putative transposon-encoded protein
MEVPTTSNQPYKQTVSLRETTQQDCEAKGAQEATRIIGNQAKVTNNAPKEYISCTAMVVRNQTAQ